MDVPTMQEFTKLRDDFAEVKQLVKQMIQVRVTVEWVGIEVAEILLNCSKRTIYRMVERNELATIKRGRSVRYSLNSIRAYLKKGQYTPEAIEARINSLFAA